MSITFASVMLLIMPQFPTKVKSFFFFFSDKNVQNFGNCGIIEESFEITLEVSFGEVCKRKLYPKAYFIYYGLSM